MSDIVNALPTDLLILLSFLAIFLVWYLLDRRVLSGRVNEVILGSIRRDAQAWLKELSGEVKSREEAVVAISLRIMERYPTVPSALVSTIVRQAIDRFYQEAQTRD